MGISLGTDNLLAPSKKINPKGYFENKDVIDIHKSLGGKIRYRPAFKDYYDSPKVKKDRQALTDYLQKFFTDEQYLAIKDPRMNDYIELWQHVLADVDVKPAEIILLRNPMDVVSSNARAWHRDTTLAMRQWQVRTFLSLRDTKDHPRIIVTYEDLFNDTLTTLKRIATKFDLPWTHDEAALQAKIDDFIDPNLQKSDSGESLAEFEAREDVAPDVKALYLLGMQAAHDETFFESDEFQQKIEKMADDYLADYGSLYRDFNAKIDNQTYYVFGRDQAAINQVNDLLAESQVVMTDDKTNEMHQVAQEISQRLASRTATLATYTKDYQLVEAKEDLNNYLRRNAKHEARWGGGDKVFSTTPEMVAAVSDEIGADTHNIVLAEDFTALTDENQQKTAIRQFVRVIKAVEERPYLVLLDHELTSDVTKHTLAEFVVASEADQTEPVDTTADEAFNLKRPLDWTEAAATLTDLARQASADAKAQAQLNHFVNVNFDEILK